MKTIAGIILILLSVFLTFYVSLYLCLFQGIIGMATSIKATPIDTLHLVIGLVRVMATGISGWITFTLTIIPGAGLLGAFKD